MVRRHDALNILDWMEELAAAKAKPAKAAKRTSAAKGTAKKPAKKRGGKTLSEATKKKIAKSVTQTHDTGVKVDKQKAKYEKAKKPPAKSASKANGKAADKTPSKRTKKGAAKDREPSSGVSKPSAKDTADTKLVENMGEEIHSAGKFKVLHVADSGMAIVTGGDAEPRLFRGKRAKASAKQYANYQAAKSGASTKKLIRKRSGHQLDPNSMVSKMRKRGLSDDQIVDEVDNSLKQFTTALMKGKGTCEIIAGVGGTGKTFGVTQVLGKENRGKTWEKFGGSMTAMDLYKFLYENRKGKVLVLDDVDVFKDTDMANILKNALDSKKVREVGWGSKSTVSKPKSMTDDEFEEHKDKELDDARETDAKSGEGKATNRESKWKPPKTFKFDSRVIFITNKPMKDILEHPHLGAVASRAIGKVDYDFDDDLVMAKLGKTYKFGGEDDPEGITKEDRDKVFNAIEDAYKGGKISNLSMRVMPNALNMYSAVGFDQMKKMLESGAL